MSWRARLTKLDALASTTEFRAAVASVAVVLHILAFSVAGRVRLHMPFNDSPSEAPYYSNVHAPETRGYPRQPVHWSRLIVSRWDAQHYIGFAMRGMSTCPRDPSSASDMDYLDCGIGWLPAWGEAGGAIASVTHLAPDYTLMIMSIIAAFILNMLWTCRTIVDRFGRVEAYAMLVAFNAFPSAFYTVTPYTESATVALLLGAMILVANRRWLLAGAVMGVATALRPTVIGFAAGLSIAAAIAAWRARKAGETRWWRPLLAIPLSGWGQIVQLSIIQALLHNPFVYVRAQAALGHHTSIHQLFEPAFYLRGLNAQHMDMVFVIGMAALVVLAGREVVNRWGLEVAIPLVLGSAVAVLLPLMSATTYYWGLNRYLLLCVIGFFAAGLVARKHPAVFALWIVICLAVYWHVELCSYIAQGNATICPCLGRMEFQFPFGS